MKQWRSFEEARAYIRSLGLQGFRQWRIYCLSGMKPEDIPSNPREVFAGQFSGFDDWLGTGQAEQRPFVVHFVVPSDSPLSKKCADCGAPFPTRRGVGKRCFQCQKEHRRKSNTELHRQRRGRKSI